MPERTKQLMGIPMIIFFQKNKRIKYVKVSNNFVLLLPNF